MALTVLNEDEIAQKGMNLLHAVGRGSNAHHASRFIHLVWKGAGEVTRRLAFVGKGVTFDTGGYSLKPAAGMFNMHGDMAGAAAVLGAAEVVGRRKPAGVEVHFIVPSAVNMVSGDAYLLNEIITGYGKKTVEINNTDAEGRLLLADALAYAAELGVDEIIDLATLTGACVVALGEHYSALFSNREEMAQRVLAASQEAGERLWPMPLDARLKDKLKSVSADMKNAGDRWGGAITAALFLQEWVGEVSWTHLDIAGPSFAEADAPLTPRGGTGVAVATLARYAGA
jgi:leucyl aminopeptidase